MGGGTMQYEKDVESGRICEPCREREKAFARAKKGVLIEIKTAELSLLKDESSDKTWTNGHLTGLNTALKLFQGGE